MVWWQEGHPICSINLASSKSVSKPHVFTPSNRDLPHQILPWLFHCYPMTSILYHDWWGNLDVKRHTHTHIHMHAYIHIHIYIYTYIYTHTHTRIHTYTYMYIHIYDAVQAKSTLLWQFWLFSFYQAYLEFDLRLTFKVFTMFKLNDRAIKWLNQLLLRLTQSRDNDV